MEKKISSYKKLQLEIQRLNDEKTAILQDVEKLVRHPEDFATSLIVVRYKIMFDSEDVYFMGKTSNNDRH